MATLTRGFSFNLNHAIQSAGVVLRDRGPMDRIRLLKILYYANRSSLEKAGKPIIGGQCSALENGPLHSEIYDQIKGKVDDREWRRYFRNKSHTIELILDPGRLDLSPFEIDLLNAAAEWAEQFETFELSNESHLLKEWEKRKPDGKSSNLIFVEDILEAIGFNADEIEDVIRDNRIHDNMSKLLEASN